MRILFSSEAGKGGRLDGDLVKRVTVSDTFTFRAIREAPETHVASAHLWIQGNASEDGTLELGLSDGDENSQALQERTKLLTRQAIPETPAGAGVGGSGLRGHRGGPALQAGGCGPRGAVLHDLCLYGLAGGHAGNAGIATRADRGGAGFVGD